MSLGDVIGAGRAPLAERLRPRRLADVVGQPQITGERTLMARAVAAKAPYSCVLYGPPGTGKTTVALVIAAEVGFAFEKLNAVTDGVPAVREVFARAKDRQRTGERTLLFIDEIHRFSKTQQDALLPAVEQGLVTLIGATTENPAFALTQALRSRLRIEKVIALDDTALRTVLDRALTDTANGLGARRLTVSDDAWTLLKLHAGGDGRAALSGLEAAALMADDGAELDEGLVREALGSRLSAAGKSESFHLLSALIKSIRGSDPNASLYWLARIEATGEDPVTVARRLVVSSAEDVGMARPGALAIANAGAEAVRNVGAPECWIALAQVACYLAECPKSWASYDGLNAARQLVAEQPEYPVPLALRNPSDAISRAEGAGQGYVHASQPGAERVRFMPREISDVVLYRRVS